MYLEVYPDVIFVINFILDFILLTILSIINRKKSRIIRRVAAAVIGAGVAALTGVFPWMNIIVRFVILNIGAAFLMLLVAFGRLKKPDLAKQLVSLYLITYSIGGLINSVYYDTNAGLSLIKLGTIVYSSLSWKKVIMIALFLIPLASMLHLFFRRYLRRGSEILEVELFLGGRRLATKGLVDSGNKLYDPVFGKPVIVLENRLMSELLTSEMFHDLQVVKGYIEGKEIDPEEKLPDKEDKLQYRIIPYQSVGNRHGLLPGLVLDKVLIHQETGTICNEKVTAAICDNCLSAKEEYQVILHKELLSEN